MLRHEFKLWWRWSLSLFTSCFSRLLRSFLSPLGHFWIWFIILWIRFIIKWSRPGWYVASLIQTHGYPSVCRHPLVLVGTTAEIYLLSFNYFPIFLDMALKTLFVGCKAVSWLAWYRGPIPLFFKSSTVFMWWWGNERSLRTKQQVVQAKNSALFGFSILRCVDIIISLFSTTTTTIVCYFSMVWFIWCQYHVLNIASWKNAPKLSITK